jgi:hypothetical protein
MKTKRPPIVCLCGSTRSGDAYRQANLELTLAGCIVLSVAVDTKDPRLAITPEQKAGLDELHLRKIELADRVRILNVGGYIGESTRRELAYAIALGCPVEFLEVEPGELFLNEHAHELGQLIGDFLVGEVRGAITSPCACPRGDACDAPPCPHDEHQGPAAVACSCHRCEAVRDEEDAGAAQEGATP